MKDHLVFVTMICYCFIIYLFLLVQAPGPLTGWCCPSDKSNLIGNKLVARALFFVWPSGAPGQVGLLCP